MVVYIIIIPDLFSRVLFSFLPPFAGHPSSSPFLGTFSPFFPPRKVLCSVEQRAHHRAWRGAVSGWISPQSSGKKFLPEICVKKGQILPVGTLRKTMNLKNCSEPQDPLNPSGSEQPHHEPQRGQKIQRIYGGKKGTREAHLFL